MVVEMDTLEYIGIISGVTIVGLIVILSGVLPSPEAVLGLPASMIGLIFLLMGGGMVVMFFGYGFMSDSLSLDRSGPQEEVWHTSQEVLALLMEEGAVDNREQLAADVEQAQTLIDQGEYDRARQILERVERAVVSQSGQLDTSQSQLSRSRSSPNDS